jgi:hypothetical protein
MKSIALFVDVVKKHGIRLAIGSTRPAVERSGIHSERIDDTQFSVEDSPVTANSQFVGSASL